METSQLEFGERYVVQARIGAGAMATVYRAKDRALARQVAVKSLHPHLASMRPSCDASTVKRRPPRNSYIPILRVCSTWEQTTRSRISSWNTSPAARSAISSTHAAHSPHHTPSRSRAHCARHSPPPTHAASCIAISSPQTSCSRTNGRRSSPISGSRAHSSRVIRSRCRRSRSRARAEPRGTGHRNKRAASPRRRAAIYFRSVSCFMPCSRADSPRRTSSAGIARSYTYRPHSRRSSNGCCAPIRGERYATADALAHDLADIDASRVRPLPDAPTVFGTPPAARLRSERGFPSVPRVPRFARVSIERFGAALAFARALRPRVKLALAALAIVVFAAVAAIARGAFGQHAPTPIAVSAVERRPIRDAERALRSAHFIARHPRPKRSGAGRRGCGSAPARRNAAPPGFDRRPSREFGTANERRPERAWPRICRCSRRTRARPLPQHDLREKRART